MNETKGETRSFHDLAKALGRWADEDSVTGSPDTALHKDEERILECLGAAVIMQWSDLPTEIQRSLFMDAASMSDPARQFELKQQIARFLHVHKDEV